MHIQLPGDTTLVRRYELFTRLPILILALVALGEIGLYSIGLTTRNLFLLAAGASSLILLRWVKITWIDLVFSAFLVWTSVSLLLSGSFPLLSPGWIHLVGACCSYFVYRVTTTTNKRRLGDILIWIGLGQAVLGVLQSINNDWLLALVGWLLSDEMIAGSRLFHQVGRSTSVWAHPATYAALLLTACAFVIERMTHEGIRLRNLLVLAVLLLAVFLAGQRGAYLLALPMLGTLVLVSKQRKRLIQFGLIAGGLGLVLVLFSGLFSLRDFAGAQNNHNIQVRLQLWRLGWDIFRTHPLFGVGLGHFHLYNPQTLVGAGVNPHSVVIKLLAETGIVGTALFASFAGAVAWVQVKCFNRGNLAIYLTWWMLLGYGLFDNTFESWNLLGLFSMLSAIITNDPRVREVRPWFSQSS